MSLEKIVLIFALLGSVAWLGEAAIRLFGFFVAKRTLALKQAQQDQIKAFEEAKIQAQADSAKAAQESIVSLVQAVQAMKVVVESVELPVSPATEAAPKEQATTSSPSASGDLVAGASLDQKVAMLAATVVSQAEQMEAIQATLRQLVESVAPQAPKRRATRKGADESGLTRANSMEARAANTPSGARHFDESMIEGLLTGMPPAETREGNFEIVR